MSRHKSNGPSHKAGFTLIELLVTTSLTAIILLTATTILMTFFLSNARTSLRREIKAEGSRALARMEFIARGAKRCTNAGGGITFTNIDDTTSKFSVNASNNLIMENRTAANVLINSEELLSKNATNVTNYPVVPGSSLELSCNQEPNSDKLYADIRFMLQNNGGSVQESFRALTVLRNSD